MQQRPYGPCAWLVEDIDNPVDWARSLSAASVSGVVDVVPAETTVLVLCDRAAHRVVGDLLLNVESISSIEALPIVTLDVVYDGEDLRDVAKHVGVSVSEVVAMHVSGAYEVAFCGFSPGFAYLKGLDEKLQIPRRDTPRTRVPAGSVAIAAHYTSVYPSASPGGWHLIGRTTAEIWNTDRKPPALLVPGREVRFHQVRERIQK